MRYPITQNQKQSRLQKENIKSPKHLLKGLNYLKEKYYGNYENNSCKRGLEKGARRI